jgi:hypothetical protein
LIEITRHLEGMKDLASLLGSAYRKSRRLYDHSTSSKLASLENYCEPSKSAARDESGAALMSSPFLKYYDGYPWPDVYTEVVECLEACALIYPLAEIRRLARAKQLQDSDRLLKLPISHAQVLDAIESNEQYVRTQPERMKLHAAKSKSHQQVRIPHFQTALPIV